MRLKEKDINKIRRIITEVFGPCEIYIFGSILDEKKRGGDVDLFIVPGDYSNLNKKVARARFLLENELLRPVDIVVHRDYNREIELEALKGVRI